MDEDLTDRPIPFLPKEWIMSDLDLMEPEAAEDLKLEAAPQPAAEAKQESSWPREQMLDRLRTSD